MQIISLLILWIKCDEVAAIPLTKLLGYWEKEKKKTPSYELGSVQAPTQSALEQNSSMESADATDII